MNEPQGKMIEVFGIADEREEGSEERGFWPFQKADEVKYGWGSVDVDDLKTRITSLLGHMDTIFQGLPDMQKSFELESLSFSVELSAKGSVSLLGTGGEVGGKGGLTFTLKRKPGQ